MECFIRHKTRGAAERKIIKLIRKIDKERRDFDRTTKNVQRLFKRVKNSLCLPRYILWRNRTITTS